MPCFKPLKAFQAATGGKPYFSNTRQNPSDRSIQFPCGQCWGCRLERSRQWAIRCVHESSLHDENCFLTLTYDDENLPYDGSLNKRHYQLFMKKLRKHIHAQTKKKIKFYMCGEYGDQLQRPHYHSIIFNYDFPDKVLYSQKEGINLYISPVLNNLWGHGFCTIGDVTFESAAYVARYVMKKIKISDKTPDELKYHYEKVNPYTGEIHAIEPEYTTMSRGGRTGQGLAADWFKKFNTDVFPSDEIVLEGRTLRTPAYYDKIFDTMPITKDQKTLKEVKQCRIEKARLQHENNTPERLAVREKVAKANHKLFKKRDYES